jgi:hypothetical protein
MCVLNDEEKRPGTADLVCPLVDIVRSRGPSVHELREGLKWAE